MKKIFYFFAVAAVVLGMASCGGENDPHLKNYKIRAIGIGEDSIHVEITANNPNKLFMSIRLEADAEAFQKDPKAAAQSAIDLASLAGLMLVPGFTNMSLMSKGKGENIFKKLAAGTDYAICVCEIDKQFQIVDEEVEYKIFRTKGEKAKVE